MFSFSFVLVVVSCFSVGVVGAENCTNLPASTCLSAFCDWCPITQLCVNLSTFLSSCPTCETFNETDCGTQTNGRCGWCPSLSSCVSNSDSFNIRRCPNCTVLDEAQCGRFPGCAFCDSSLACVELAGAPATCSCASVDNSSCDAAAGCAWCTSSSACTRGATSEEFAANCPSCSLHSPSACPAPCSAVCSGPTAGCESRTNSSSCAAGADCLWDPLLLLCFNSSTINATCAGAGVTTCPRTPGCRWCTKNQSCMVEASYLAGDCDCSAFTTNATCQPHLGCSWCAGTLRCIDARTQCPDPESLNQTECAAAMRDWCDSMWLCNPANMTGFETSFCKCHDVSSLSICWWWQGCESCTADACAPTNSCVADPSSSPPPLPPPPSHAALSSSARERPPKSALMWGLIGGGVGLVVIVSAVVVIAVACAVSRRSSSTPDSDVPLSLRRFDTAGSKEFVHDDPAFGLLMSKASLDFGASTAPLDVDKAAKDQVVLTNTSTNKIRWFLAKAEETERYELKIEPSEGTVKPEEQVAVDLEITPLCTTVLDISIPLVVDGVGHAFLRVKARTTLTIKLDYSELRIESNIGEGAYGRVYRGTWRSTDVAIKEYRAGILEIDRIKQDVLREIDLLSRLRSPHVITFYGVVLTKTHCAIVMEFLPLGSLGSLLKRQPIGLPLKMKFSIGCAHGMQFLHANHVLHRDLKTDNLLVVSVDPASPIHVKLTDFGASRLVSDEGAATYTKGVGTANYMPPEILNNQAYSSKADVYSFALVLWSIFSQKHPYEDFSNQYQIIKFVVEGNRPTPPAGCPAPVIKIMENCWQHNPESRPTFDEVVAAFEAQP